MLENGVPMATVAQILGWSASTAIRMAKRHGHIRPDAQRRALEGIATAMPDSGLWESGDFNGEVHQKVHQLQGSN